MWKVSSLGRPRPTRPPQLSLDDGLMLWRARDVYRARHFVHSLLVTALLLQFLAIAGLGHWGLACAVVGLQGGALWGLRWGWRHARQWGQTWWRRLGLVVVLSLGLSGCESIGRDLARLHGVKVDPLPGPCAPESFQAGQCLAVKQGGKP